MDEPCSAGSAGTPAQLTWVKSRHSNPSGNCVELACLPTGEIAVRNSRYPAGPVLVYTRAEMAAFLSGAREGEFDFMVSLSLRSQLQGAPRGPRACRPRRPMPGSLP